MAPTGCATGIWKNDSRKRYEKEIVYVYGDNVTIAIARDYHPKIAVRYGKTECPWCV